MKRKVEDLERSAEAARRGNSSSDCFLSRKISILRLLSFPALEDQGRITKELEEKRKQAEEAQFRLQQEREEAEREHGRMMERVRYEQEEKDKIVRCWIRFRERNWPFFPSAV